MWKQALLAGLFVMGVPSGAAVGQEASPAPPPETAATPPAAVKTTAPDLASAFAGFSDGTFVASDLDGDELAVYNDPRADRRVAPCSTFKIANALISLDTGVVSEEDSERRWDGSPVPYEVWARDQDLGSAIRYSVVWYFQGLATQVGPERMQAYLDRFDYGNRDISAGQTRFWLNTSLKITPREQLRFLRKLYRLELPVAERHQRYVEQLLVQKSGDGWEVAGKTGSCHLDDGGGLGWFVGHVRATDGREVVFATNVEAPEGADGTAARRVSFDILRRLGLIPTEE